jgi:hypothetical protein
MAGSFAGRFRDAMIGQGFVRHGNGVLIGAQTVSCFADAKVVRRWPGVTFGLWFHELKAGDVPTQTHLFHYYQGVDGLLGLDFSIRTAAYEKSDEELAAQIENVLGFTPQIAVELKALTDINKVVRRYEAGKFGGLLFKETRLFLGQQRDASVR